MDCSLRSVSSRGQLANAGQLAFANKLLSLCQSRDTELFKSLLSDATRKELDGPDNNKQMVRYHLREIENGTFLYGQWDFKRFATFRPLTQDDLDRLSKHVSFAKRPTHAIHFFHFHKPNYMLIGTSTYLVQEADSYRIVTGTLLKGELPPVAAEEDPSGPKTYGIISFEQDDEAYSVVNAWRYVWTVELALEESENYTFALIKLTDAIEGEDPDLHPEIAEDILIAQEVFAKYRYKELKFRFWVGDNAPDGNYSRHGRRLSGWSYGFSIASISRSSSMLFPGTSMTNVQIRQEGGFVGSDLEFLSFETEEANVRYRHRVVLRKTPLVSAGSTQRDRHRLVQECCPPVFRACRIILVRPTPFGGDAGLWHNETGRRQSPGLLRRGSKSHRETAATGIAETSDAPWGTPADFVSIPGNKRKRRAKTPPPALSISPRTRGSHSGHLPQLRAETAGRRSSRCLYPLPQILKCQESAGVLVVLGQSPVQLSPMALGYRDARRFRRDTFP
jgi:hypothetical protein